MILCLLTLIFKNAVFNVPSLHFTGSWSDNKAKTEYHSTRMSTYKFISKEGKCIPKQKLVNHF